MRTQHLTWKHEPCCLPPVLLSAVHIKVSSPLPGQCPINSGSVIWKSVIPSSNEVMQKEQRFLEQKFCTQQSSCMNNYLTAAPCFFQTRQNSRRKGKCTPQQSMNISQKHDFRMQFPIKLNFKVSVTVTVPEWWSTLGAVYAVKPC